MRTRISNLMERDGRFYYRCKVPDQIIGSSQKKEIRISLRTSDLQTAIGTCKLVSTQVDEIFKSAENKMISLDIIRQRVAMFVKESLESSERHLANYGEISPCSLEEGVKQNGIIIKACEEALRTNNLKHLMCDGVGEYILKGLKFDDSDLNLTAREVLRARVYIAEICNARLSGLYNHDYDKIDYKEIMNGRYRLPDRDLEFEETYSIKQLMDEFVSEKERGWKPKTKDNYCATLDLFLEVYGDKDILTVKHKDLKDFRDDILMKIPPNMKSNLSKFSVSEAIKNNNGKTLTVHTVNLRLDKLCAFFRWCYQHEYLPKDITHNLKLPENKRKDEERIAYSPAELEKIFSLLTDNPVQLNQWEPYKLWITLIAFFCGARQNEIAQLYTEDIIVKDGFPCFKFTDEDTDDKSIKNKASYRTIPIHPVLLQLGLLDIVLSQIKAGHNHIWHGLKHSGESYGQTFQRFYGRFNRKYITKDSRKVFHCFRHGFSDCMKQQGVEERLTDEITGHAGDRKSMSYGYYAQSYNPSIMLEAITKFNPQIDIFAVLGRQPLSSDEIDKQIEQLPVEK